MTPASSFSLAAPAKINLYLHVKGRRDDGYHLLDSLVAFAGIHDTLTFSPADDLSLIIDGPFADELDGERDNLVLKAADALARLTGVTDGARIQLTKRLPVAAGIGGGSSDAAAALKGLMRLWNVHPEAHELRALALTLGADVPVCLNGRAAFISGIGEDIVDAPALPLCSLVLVNPGVHLSTPNVFKARADRDQPDVKVGRFEYAAEDAGELVSILNARYNDLAPAAERLAPAIADVLAALTDCNGAMMARMSGSGATCFAIFEHPGEAAAATLKLAERYPGWWVRAGSLEGDINRLG